MATTITITAYTVRELETVKPKAFRAAFEQWRAERVELEHEWVSHEAGATIRALMAALGQTRFDYELNPYGRSRLSAHWPMGEDELRGARLMALLENRIFGPARIPWEPLSQNGSRRNLSRLGRHYRAGEVLPCPLTGVHTDDEVLTALSRGAREGCDLAECLNLAAESLARALEDGDEGYYLAEFLDLRGDDLVDEWGRFV